MFAGGGGVAAGGVHDDHALAGGGGAIDVVDAHAGASDHLELGGGFEDHGGDLGSTPDAEPVEFADDLGQLGGVVGGLVVVDDDLDLAGGLEDLLGQGRHVVA